MYQDLYQDLVSYVHSRALGDVIRPGFTPYALTKNGRRYWYARQGSGQTPRVRYLGKETPELLEWIARARTEANNSRECREIVTTFLRAGFPAPSRDACAVLDALSLHGFFRLRGVLIGSVAFTCYPGMLGVPRFEGKLAHRTNDVDIAMFRSISVAVDDRLATSMKGVLDAGNPIRAFAETMDEGFVPILDLDNRPSSKWRNRKTGMSVDLLTPFTPPEQEENVYLPSLREKVLKAKFLDFLIYNETPSVILSGEGIPVNVPEPGRYAIHKLLVTTMRKDVAKRVKDMEQAIQLLDILLRDDSVHTLELFGEAWERGPAWRKRLRESVFAPRFPENMRREFTRLVSDSCRESIASHKVKP